MDTMDMARNALERAGHKNFIDDLLGNASASEISTVLLALNQAMAERVSPPELLRRYEENRFVKPSPLDPVRLNDIANEMLTRARALGFAPVALSMAAPLGCCSAIAKVSQHQVLSGVRGTELLSDCTNALALHAAAGIRAGTMDNANAPLHFCAAERVTRGQLFGWKGALAHFMLFGMISAGRDRGSYAFELEALRLHIGYYFDYYESLGVEDMQAVLSRRPGYTDGDGLAERALTSLRDAFPGREVLLGDSSDNLYYTGLNFKMRVNGGFIADGGFTDWTQTLLSNRKQRLCISGAGIDLQIVRGLAKE